MKKLLKFMFLAIIVTAFNSCSSDDEPQVVDAQWQYENIVKMFYDSQSKQPVFTSTPTEGLYLAAADDSESSHRYIEKVIGKNWDGKNTTIELGEYGTIQLISSNDEMVAEGIYHEIIVNIKGYMPFTLKIIDEERANEDNGYTGTGVVHVS